MAKQKVKKGVYVTVGIYESKGDWKKAKFIESAYYGSAHKGVNRTLKNVRAKIRQLKKEVI